MKALAQLNQQGQICTDVENHSRFLLSASEKYFNLPVLLYQTYAELYFKIILDKLTFSVSVTLRDIQFLLGQYCK